MIPDSSDLIITIAQFTVNFLYFYHYYHKY